MHRRILSIVSVFSALFLVTKVSAQKDVELVNSGQVLYDGNFYYYTGHFQKAEDEFRKVGRNDTNYAEVLRDLALVYSDDKQDSLCALTCKTGIDLKSSYSPDFYTLLGVSLKEMSKYDSAVKVFDKAIELYPYSYALLYQKGMLYYKKKDYKEAEKWFQAAIKINPYHASSHFQLGKICAEEGRLIPAMLAYEFYLMLDPSVQSDRAKKVVSQLEDLTTGDYAADPDMKLSMTEAGDDCFSDVNDIISNGKAYNEAYKNTTKINLKLVKQLQMLFEKIQYKEGTGNWYMDYYVPFYNEMWTKMYFTPFVSYNLASVSDNNVTVAKSIKKNKKKITAFAKWAGDYIDKHLQHPAKKLLNFSDSDEVDYVYYDSHALAGVGKVNDSKKPIGEWIYLYEMSGHVFGRGKFDDMGKKTGEWTYWWSNGQIKEKSNFVDGERDGASEEYHDNGVLSFTGTYVKGKLDGRYVVYAIHGGKKEEADMTAGVLNGEGITYYSNGGKRLEMHYKMDKLDGSYKTYSLDGTMLEEANYVLGKQSGASKEWYDNGALKSEGEYKNDKPVGAWKVYWDNGKLKREGNYIEAGRTGEWKEYHFNGNPAATANYKNGDYNGDVKDYDTDGIVYEVRNYINGKLKTMSFLDKQGSSLAQYVMTTDDLKVTEYYPSGVRSAEGNMSNGDRNGDWKIYSDNGGWLYAREHYDYGYLNGERTSYWQNGKKYEQDEYAYGSLDGYHKAFYQNGTISEEGWYKNDDAEGDWYYYNERGIVIAHKYYLTGIEWGYQDYYDQFGRKDEEDYLKSGFVWTRTRYDSTGAVVYTWESDNGTGEYHFNYPNGKPFVVQQYKNGYREGATQRFAFDGSPMLEVNYINGSMYGTRKEWYRDSHKPYIELEEAYDSKHGKSTGWWENGNKRWEENYDEGDLEGVQNYYYENGQLAKTGNWDAGNVEGELKFYSDDGSLEYVRYYHNGNLLGYSYNDKDGKLVPMIKLEDASGDFTAYYQNGDTSITGHYENGKLNGRVVEYYPNGKIAEDENYSYSDYTGVQRYYYSNGNLKKELNYYSDALDGVQKFYYENGKLEHTEVYVLDDYYGTWNYYDANGNPTIIKTWYDDMQMSETQAAVPVQTIQPKSGPKGKSGGK